jgi:putative ubiquitin-RnfH superfamily antitoxin RatB of RatAB toxin-antitoxin module
MENDAGARLTVRVCHARTHQAWTATVTLAAGATVADAIAASGFTRDFPGVDPWKAGVGLYGHLTTPERTLEDGDRLEIYRPLTFDPMESRRRRAAHRARKRPTARPPRTPKAPR